MLAVGAAANLLTPLPNYVQKNAGVSSAGTLYGGQITSFRPVHAAYFSPSLRRIQVASLTPARSAALARVA
jgi:hypothetical protein